MFKFTAIIFFFCLVTNSLASDVVPIITSGSVKTGENRLDISSDDFLIDIENLSNLKIKSRLVAQSLQWVRVKKSVLLPRMKLEVLVDTKSPNLSLVYLDQAVLPQQIKKVSYFQFFVSLFHPSPIDIYLADELVAKITISPKKNSQGLLVDYSCTPYSLEVEGAENIFLSAGCNLTKSGSIGQEHGLLEVHWSSPNLELLNGKKSPYLTNLTLQHSSVISLKDNHGDNFEIKLKAKVPRRVHRLKTAVGFGPHVMTSREGDETSANDITSPILFYGRFTLTPETSFRFFNAFFYSGSFFNKFGLYFAYDVGSGLDGRLTVTPLLGLQAISFKSEFSSRTHTRGIYPQGLELVYNHAFGLENYKLILGAFLSPDSSDEYRNTWVRFGKKVFWEINYLSWGHDDLYSKQWGLSVGVPFMSFF
jgi:hypothetical protein